MHEASIALSILDAVIGQCRKEGFVVIQSVRIMIGKAAGILPDALVFAFDVAKAGTIANNAELLIELVRIGGDCRGCGQDFEIDDSRFVYECPRCGSSSIKVNRGYEMQIIDMEVD